MTFTPKEKQEIFQQIDEFYNETLEGGVVLGEARFFATSEFSKEISNFLKFLKPSFPSKPSIIDLCFGSGNLTSHIILDLDINFSKLVFNDILNDKTNQSLKLKGNITDNNFLDSSLFSEKFDIVIFNPQIGGRKKFKEGELKLTKETRNKEKVVETLAHLIKNSGFILLVADNNEFENKLESKNLFVTNMLMKDEEIKGSKNLYIVEKKEKKPVFLCFEKHGTTYIKNDECKKRKEAVTYEGDIEDLFLEITNKFSSAKESIPESIFTKKGASEAKKENSTLKDKSIPNFLNPEVRERSESSHLKIPNFLKREHKEDNNDNPIENFLKVIDE